MERLNRTMLKAIRTAHSEGRDWKIALIQFLRDYRSFPHSTTKESPAKLLFNRELRTKMPQIAKKNLRNHTTRMLERMIKLQKKRWREITMHE